MEPGTSLGRTSRLHARLSTDLVSFPAVVEKAGASAPRAFRASSGHMVGQSVENMCSTHSRHICQATQPPGHVARLTTCSHITTSASHFAGSFQHGLQPTPTAAVASCTTPPTRSTDLGAQLRPAMVESSFHTGNPYRSTAQRPARAYVPYRSPSTPNHRPSQCRARSTSCHPEDLQPQGFRYGSSSPTPDAAHPSSPSPGLPQEAGPSSSHPLLPGMPVHASRIATGETTHTPPLPPYPLLLCTECRHRIPWTAPPGFTGAGDGRTRQHTHHQELSQKYPHIQQTSSCFNGDQAAPSVRAPTGEDFCLLPTVFCKWIHNLPTTFPHPHVDTWASPQQHLLPLYGVDFFHTPYPSHWILWINPRFSHIASVISHMQTHHLQGYLLFPHWTDTEWWDTVWKHLTHQWFFPHGMHAFFGTSQTPSNTQPTGWPFSIAFFTFTEQAFPTSHLPNPNRNRYWQLLAGAKYPPLVPHYGSLHLPKCFRTAMNKQRSPPSTFLAPVSTHIIDYQALLELGHRLHFPKLPLLQEMVRALSCPLAFHALHHRPLRPGPGQPSTMSHACLQQAVQAKILDNTVKPKLYSAAFLIPKANPQEGGRLILPCKETNAALRTPLWPCELADVVTVISVVLSWSYAVEYDYRSYYFQFPLGRLLQPWFGVRRGSFKASYTKLPQGWSPAASVAQTTSELCIHDLLSHPLTAGQLSLHSETGIHALVHIDNTAIGGDREDTVRALMTEFLHRCDFIGVELKQREVTITTHLKYVGVDFDLTRKQYRLIPQWAHATASFIAEVSSVLEDGFCIPLRIIWQVLGNLFWTAHVCQLALGQYWRTMQFTRRTAPKTNDNRAVWDRPHSVPAGVLAEWHEFYERLQSNGWLTPPPRSPALDCFTALLASDSSTPAGGFCWQDLPLAQQPTCSHQASWWQWPPRVRQNFSLPAREALACIRASQDALPHMSRPIVWLVDCLPVLQALHKGSSGKPVLNALILCLRKLEGILWLWVPTALMPADTYSRRTGFSPMHRHPGSIITWQLQHFLHVQLQKPVLHVAHSWMIL